MGKSPRLDPFRFTAQATKSQQQQVPGGQRKRVFVLTSYYMHHLLLLTVCCGCTKGPELVPVTGTILLKGQPLEFGSIMVQPIGTEGAKTARSKIAADGSFALSTDEPGDGVGLGKARVRITAFEAQKTELSGGQHQELALGRSAVPRKFNSFGTSGIVIDVQSDMELPLTIELDDYQD